MLQVVIASRLGDGRVVFLARDAAERVEWVELLGDDVSIADDAAAAEQLLAIGEADAEARHEVVDPYLIDVERAPDGLRPTKYRELIRCLGPTIRQDLGKQTEGRGA